MGGAGCSCCCASSARGGGRELSRDIIDNTNRPVYNRQPGSVTPSSSQRLGTSVGVLPLVLLAAAAQTVLDWGAYARSELSGWQMRVGKLLPPLLLVLTSQSRGVSAQPRSSSGSAEPTAAATSPEWPAPQTDNLAPRFSWNTMGDMVFMQLCNPNATLESPGYPASVMRTLSKYPMVTFEKCVGTFTAGFEEDKVIRSCTALKALNPEISGVFYLNTELDFTGFRLHDEFERHPEYWLQMPNGSGPVRQHGPNWGCTDGACPANGLKLADFSVPAAAAYWLIACANVTAHASVDGCNLDRASHLGNFTELPHAAAWAPRHGAQAFNDGKLAAFQKLQSVVGAGPVIANCHSCLTDTTTIPGVFSQVCYDALMMRRARH
jgi:hypothetical protein